MPSNDMPSLPSTKAKLKFVVPLRERTNITKEVAQDLFAPLTEVPYEHVEISGHAVLPSASSVAALALATLAKKKCLRSLIIADCIASLKTTEALHVLSALCDAVGKNWNGLRVVDLSSNALGSRGIAACVAVLRDQPQLEELFLSNNGLAKQSTKLLRMHLSGRGKTNLKVFHCTLNCIEGEGLRDLADIIKDSPAMEQLRLSSLRSDAAGTTYLCQALAGTDKLRLLDISDNGFNETTATALATALGRQKQLEALILRDLALPIDLIEEIIEPLLANQPPLNTLDLSGNELTAAACPVIGRILSTFKDTLRCLYLADTEFYGKAITGMTSMLESNPPPALRVLSLASNKMRDFEAVTLATSILKLDQFHELDIGDNYVNEDTVNAIKKCLGDVVSGEKMVEEDMKDEIDSDCEDEYSENEIENVIEEMKSVAINSKIGPSIEDEDEAPSIAMDPQTAEDVDQLADFVAQTSLGSTVTASEGVGPNPTPTPSRSEQAEEDGGSGDPAPRRDEATTSARKLNSDLAEIRGVLTGFVQSLNSVQDVTPRRLPFEDDDEEMDSEGEESESDGKMGYNYADVVSGFFISLFVVVLVLGIVKSNEEGYPYRPI